MMFSTVALGQIATPIFRPVEVIPGETYRTIGVKWWGEGAYERASIDGSQTAAKILSLVRENDLIINKIWVRHGSAAIASKKVDGCAASGEFPLFDLDTTQVLPRWLHWQTKTKNFWDKCDELSRGTSGKNRIRPELFLTIKIPLPPLDEQRRIVARIEELAAKIEEARGLRREIVEEAHSLKRSYLNSLFSSDKAINWTSTSLGNIADIRAGVTLGRFLQGPTIDVPYLRVANVQDGRLDLRVIKRVSILPDELEKWKLQNGDILLTEGGDWDKLGRGTVWRDEMPDCIHQNHIFRIRLDQTRFDPKFIVEFIGSPIGKTYFQAAAKQTTNLASINQRQLKAFNILIPSFDEQRRIVAHLDALQERVDTLKREQAASAAELDALLPSILDKAFKGEL